MVRKIRPDHCTSTTFFPWALTLFSNLWLFSPLVSREMSNRAETNALLRTTLAPTMFKAGVKDNSLPEGARAVVNLRIHPQDRLQPVIERVKQVIADPRVEVGILEGSVASQPSPVSRDLGPGFRAIAEAIRATFPQAAVAPGLFVAATDSRHYQAVAEDVYRFMPYVMRPADRARIHGTNERLSEDNFRAYLRFYAQVLQAAGQ